MSAASRAEARRKAILSRGTDRLAKLTTSARGEDAPAYMHDGIHPNRRNASIASNARSFVPDPPLPNLSTDRLVGEGAAVQSVAGRPPPRLVAEPPAPPDPSVWSPEQQQQFLQAMMGGVPQNQSQGPPLSFTNSNIDNIGGPLPQGSELTSLLSSFSQFPGAVPDPATKSGATNTYGKAPAPPTRLQKILPLIHLLSVWCLLAYFVLWREPQAFREGTAGVVEEDWWVRWAKLAWRNAGDVGWGVQAVPFFWAFTTLQIVLHSMRIFSGFDKIQPPMLISLALPHLPPALSTVILAGLTYLQIGGVFLDDIAGIVVGFGFIVAVSSWGSGE